MEYKVHFEVLVNHMEHKIVGGNLLILKITGSSWNR